MKYTIIATVFTLLVSNVSIAQYGENACDQLNDSMYTHNNVTVWMDTFMQKFHVDQPWVVFNKDLLDQLYAEVGDHSNLRIYFTSISTTEISLPGAVIIPYSMEDCASDFPDRVLTADYGGIPGVLGSLSERTYLEMQNWAALCATSSMSGLDTVYAYNFSWNHVRQATKMGTKNLWVAYGISNQNNNPDDGDAIHMYLTYDEPLRVNWFLDFSRPCPKLCGNLLK